MTAVKPYSLEAYNTARHSENKMHDDAVAKQFGFSGGLVPGVDVYAYMSHVPLQVWGRAFLERGEMEGRFIKPVYDGEIATVTATEAPAALSLMAPEKTFDLGGRLPKVRGNVALVKGWFAESGTRWKAQRPASDIPLLVHVVLFGSGYAARAVAAARTTVRLAADIR